MSGKFLLDTNIAIAFLNGDSSIRLKVQKAAEVHISVTVIGELLFGAEKSSKPKENISKIESMCKDTSVLPIDEETAKKYAKIKADLSRRGHPIPENDIWIAASTERHNLTLVSNDSHFKAIPSIKLESW